MTLFEVGSDSGGGAGESAIRPACLACLLAGVVLLLAVGAASAAVIQTADDRQITGDLVSLDAGVLTLRPAPAPAPGNPAQPPPAAPPDRRIRLDDLASVTLGGTAGAAAPSTLVVDNDGDHPLREATGTIALMAGKHPVTVFYFFNTDGPSILHLEYASTAMPRQPVPASAFSHLGPDQQPPAPAGLAPNGMRRPDPVTQLRPHLLYSYCENPGPAPWHRVADMVTTPPTTTGTANRVDLAVAERARDFGLCFTGYIDVPDDAQYTFFLSSNRGSRLYIGPPPDIRPPVAATQPSQVLWTVTLAWGDRLNGQISAWTDAAITLNPSFGGPPLIIPTRSVREVWRSGAERPVSAGASGGVSGGAVLPGPATSDDTAFVRKDDQLQSVSGLAMGIRADSLVFTFNNHERLIELNRLTGVILGGARPARDDAIPQRIELASGEAVSGSWVALSGGNLTLRLPWGQEVHLPLERVHRIQNRHGRLVYLSDLQPVAVEQVPYFDRMMGYRLDASLTGGLIRLADGVHDKGVAVHARCVLTYELGGQFERFRCRVGFEQPEGHLGLADLRVVTDGKVLLNQPGARGDAVPTDVDVDVSGAKRLTLEVDFGQGRGVAARVVWADARLLRAAQK